MELIDSFKTQFLERKIGILKLNTENVQLFQSLKLQFSTEYDEIHPKRHIPGGSSKIQINYKTISPVVLCLRTHSEKLIP